MDIPEWLEYWSVDQIAECLSYDDPDGSLYARLWNFLGEGDDVTPVGGDGSDGTAETPDACFGDDHSDSPVRLWPLLTDAHRNALSVAYAKAYPDDV